jgi:hypothetical protein
VSTLLLIYLGPCLYLCVHTSNYNYLGPHMCALLKQAAIFLSTTGEYGTLPLSQCAWFYASGNILATTCSPYSLPWSCLSIYFSWVVPWVKN